MTMDADMNLTMNMDVQLSPMAVHAKGTASGKDENGNLKREDIELYIADDWMYMKTPDRGWIKTKGANTEFQELIKQNHEQAQYHAYAPYLTIAEQGDTYVLTGNLPSSAAVQSKVTLEIDKATLYQKRYVTELTHGDSVQKMEMTFFNFDKAPAIEVPAEVKAAAVEQ
jgi:hypothetical protein